MPRKCVICNVYDKNNEKSFYSFPKCGEQKKLWMNVCNIKLCLPSFKICQDHFKEQDFTNGCPRKNAVPFLNNVSSSVDESSFREDFSSNNTVEDPVCITPKKKISSPCQLSDTSSISQTKLNSSTSKEFTIHKHKRFNADTVGLLSPSHFDSPRKSKKHLTMVKQTYKQKQIQNSNLRKQVKRLQSKVKTYEDRILKLQQQNLITENALFTYRRTD